MRTEDARATEPPCVVNPLRDEDSDPWRPPFRPSRPPFRSPRRNGRLQPGTGGRLPAESLVAFGLESVVAFDRNTHFHILLVVQDVLQQSNFMRDVQSTLSREVN